MLNLKSDDQPSEPQETNAQKIEGATRVAPVVKRLLQNGYDVTRWHVFPNIKPQNLASHSWSVAMIIMSLFNGSTEDKLLLVHAALEHDLVEKEIGDMPRPGRTEQHRELEREVAFRTGVFHESMLPVDLRPWLEWADLIEAGMHAHRELNLGNKSFREVTARIRQHLHEHRALIPIELWIFAREAGLA